MQQPFSRRSEREFQLTLESWQRLPAEVKCSSTGNVCPVLHIECGKSAQAMSLDNHEPATILHLIEQGFGNRIDGTADEDHIIGTFARIAGIERSGHDGDIVEAVFQQDFACPISKLLIAFERDHGVPYDSIVSSDSSEAMLAFQGALAAAAVPTTLVVDPEGRVAARVVGPVTASTLRALIEPVLAETDAQD